MSRKNLPRIARFGPPLIHYTSDWASHHHSNFLKYYKSFNKYVCNRLVWHYRTTSWLQDVVLSQIFLIRSRRVRILLLVLSYVEMLLTVGSVDDIVLTLKILLWTPHKQPLFHLCSVAILTLPSVSFLFKLLLAKSCDSQDLLGQNPFLLFGFWNALLSR